MSLPDAESLRDLSDRYAELARADEAAIADAQRMIDSGGRIAQFFGGIRLRHAEARQEDLRFVATIANTNAYEQDPFPERRSSI